MKMVGQNLSLYFIKNLSATVLQNLVLGYFLAKVAKCLFNNVQVLI